jgi:hypothetical protein
MSVHPTVWQVLELAECCALEQDIPRDLKETVRYAIASELCQIQPVFAVLRGTTERKGQLFGDRPQILSGDDSRIKDPKLLAASRKHVRFRLLLKRAGEALLAERRLGEQGSRPETRDRPECRHHHS